MDRPPSERAMLRILRRMSHPYRPEKFPPFRAAAEALAQKALLRGDLEAAALAEQVAHILWCWVGAYAAARPYLEQALAIRRRILGEQHPKTLKCYWSLGSLLQDVGEFAAARPLIERALATESQLYGEKHSRAASNCYWLAALLERLGEYDESLLLAERALALNAERYGHHHRATAGSYNWLGGLLQKRGNLDGARYCYEQALAIHQQLGGVPHWRAAQDLTFYLWRVGEVLKELGEYAAALPYLAQIFVIKRAQDAKAALGAAQDLYQLGIQLQAAGDFQRARTCYAAALPIFQQELGDDNPRVLDVAVRLRDVQGGEEPSADTQQISV